MYPKKQHTANGRSLFSLLLSFGYLGDTISFSPSFTLAIPRKLARDHCTLVYYKPLTAVSRSAGAITTPPGKLSRVFAVSTTVHRELPTGVYVLLSVNATACQVTDLSWLTVPGTQSHLSIFILSHFLQIFTPLTFFDCRWGI